MRNIVSSQMHLHNSRYSQAHLRLLTYHMRVLCIAPGGSLYIRKYIASPVRSKEVCRQLAYQLRIFPHLSNIVHLMLGIITGRLRISPLALPVVIICSIRNSLKFMLLMMISPLSSNLLQSSLSSSHLNCRLIMWRYIIVVYIPMLSIWINAESSIHPTPTVINSYPALSQL